MGFLRLHTRGPFFDEIGDISPKLQSRLLRVIQEREIIRLGNDTVIPIDVRVICATNRDLKKEVARGNFREDLLYRLDVLELNLPPLRKRKQDILYLADRMVRFEHERTGSRLEAITQEGRELLMRYNWPGNVREMRNFCERICILCEKTRAGAEDVLQALPGEWEYGGQTASMQTAGMQTAVPAARIFRRPAVMYRRRPQAPAPSGGSPEAGREGRPGAVRLSQGQDSRVSGN